MNRKRGANQQARLDAAWARDALLGKRAISGYLAFFAFQNKNGRQRAQTAGHFHNSVEILNPRFSLR
jgi:hypothetical protein